MIDHILSTIAPHICSGCAEYGTVLCKSCRDDIAYEDFGRCVWCLGLTAPTHQCTTCRTKIGARGAWAVGERADVLKRLLNDYKFESHREAAKPLAELLDYALPLLPADTIVTWVPTTPAHIRARGFDHARLLAHEFAQRRDMQIRPLLERHQTLSQHELSRSAREAAAKQAFGLRDSPAPSSVLLIDDILTTGATLRACTSLLRSTGAEVYVAVVGRQPLDG